MSVSFAPLHWGDKLFCAIRTGTIPKELGKLTALKELYLNSNNLTGENHEGCVTTTNSKHNIMSMCPANAWVGQDLRRT